MIKFLDLQKINKPYHEQFQVKMKQVLDTGWFILGEEVKVFEENFANYCGSKYCVGVGNGLDAIVLTFKAYIELGVLKQGDEVIVPANTYIASILAIVQAGLTPILVEPNIETYNIDAKKIEEKITPKTKVILIVHLYGQLAQMDALINIGYIHNLLLIEDAAQAHGLHFEGSHTRTFSFYPGKNLGALGDGGAVVTNDEKLATLLKSLRNYGSQKKYYNDYIGYNSRLDEIQAAFLNIKLPYLVTENGIRKQIAQRYITEIINNKIILPKCENFDNHVFHLFVIRTQDRNNLQDYLTKNGIETMIHYPVAPHKQKAFLEWDNMSFPITEKIHNQVLSLPISPVMTNDEVSFVIKVLNKY
jgi:dTDP-4-amino-4,6-dideoxygalactose transaminase